MKPKHAVAFVFVVLPSCTVTKKSPSPPQQDSTVHLPDCTVFHSESEEYAPVQQVGSGFPATTSSLTWQRPSPYTYFIDFSGVPGQSATHEGADYVHDDPGVSEVTVSAAADGIVVYVRTGCTQSSTFASNTSLRECGSGWGNHVVVDHGGSHTRYAHLAPEQVWVQVGEQVKMGDGIGLMGNSGRSEVRHLHFELGTTSVSFEPCDSAQSFELVYNPELLF